MIVRAKYIINHIGLIQRAITKYCLCDYDDISNLVGAMNLDHHKKKGDYVYTVENLMPYLVKMVRKNHKWASEVKEWKTYQRYVKLYRLDKVRNYSDMAKLMKEGK